MQKNRAYSFRYMLLFIPLLILELVFHYVQYHTFDSFSIIRMVLFCLLLSTIFDLVFRNNDLFFIISLIFLTLLASYSFVELIFKNFMGDYYSFTTVSDGATRISQYALIFLSNAKPYYYYCLIIIPIFVLLYRYIKVNTPHYILSIVRVVIASSLLFYSLLSSDSNLLNTYIYSSNKDVLIDKTGISHFLFRDLLSLFYKPEETIEIVEEVEVVEEDVVWNAYIDAEENENIKNIDYYLLSKQKTEANEKTAIFEDYNFIYIMTEALDYLSIDEKLTPTLYKMYNDGYTFYNHYTPLYSCATGESEFVSYTSLFPYVDYCTPNVISDTYLYQALPFLFKDKGYNTISLHNWRDEFYERHTTMKNLGFDSYVDIDEIWKNPNAMHTNGWQSDKDLIQTAIDRIDNLEGNFYCNIISSVMHFPYDESSYWGDYYLKEIDKVHPNWSIEYKRYMSKCMNFDSGLELLLNYLEENNLSDNTVICIYADHRPYWLDYQVVKDYTKHLNDRSGEYGIYRSPFIIYNSNIDPEVNYHYCSTLDHVPTIANLFNLNYDSRLYMGTDIYSSDNRVIFTNGSWLDSNGEYDAVKNIFNPYHSYTYSENQLETINSDVKKIINFSKQIFDESYFSKRKEICYPKQD